MKASRKSVPCYRKRIGLSLGEMSGLHVNRVTRVTSEVVWLDIIRISIISIADGSTPHSQDYAVGSKPGEHLEEQPDSPPAGLICPKLPLDDSGSLCYA